MSEPFFLLEKWKIMYYQNEDIGLVDLFWFAVDQRGQIAVFCSCGSDAVPPRLSRTANSILNLYFEHSAEKRGGITELVDLQEHVGEDAETYREFAKRGLFGYDHGEESNADEAYLLIVRPKNPISLADLPDWIRSLFGSQALSLTFSDTPNIDDALIKGGEHRIVPKVSEVEQRDALSANNLLWKRFIEEFSLRFEKNETTCLYELEDLREFCPDCFEKRGDYVEIGCETSGYVDSGQYWVNRYRMKRHWHCRLCGYDIVEENDI